MLALPSCGIPRDEPFVEPFSKVSGPAGTIWFVHSDRVRSCSWFECGESTFKYLGASVEAMLLKDNGSGGLELVSLARIACDGDRIDACDTIANRPHLRRGTGGPVLENSVRSPDRNTLAWQFMRDRELGAGVWLCASAAFPGSDDAEIVKVAPTADLTRIAEVVYLLHRAPAGEETAQCADTAGLPRPAGVRETLLLADALRDAAGRLNVVYLAKDDPTAWRKVVTMVAVDDGGWRARRTETAGEVEPLYMPGLLDARAARLVMDGGEFGKQMQLTLSDVDRGGAETVRIPLP